MYCTFWIAIHILLLYVYYNKINNCFLSDFLLLLMLWLDRRWCNGSSIHVLVLVYFFNVSTAYCILLHSLFFKNFSSSLSKEVKCRKIARISFSSVLTKLAKKKKNIQHSNHKFVNTLYSGSLAHVILKIDRSAEVPYINFTILLFHLSSQAESTI